MTEGGAPSTWVPTSHEETSVPLIMLSRGPVSWPGHLGAAEAETELLFSRGVSGALCSLPPAQPWEPVLSAPAVTMAAGQRWNKEGCCVQLRCTPFTPWHFSDSVFFYLFTQTSGQYLIVFHQQGLGLGTLKNTQGVKQDPYFKEQK